MVALGCAAGVDSLDIGFPMPQDFPLKSAGFIALSGSRRALLPNFLPPTISPWYMVGFWLLLAGTI